MHSTPIYPERFLIAVLGEDSLEYKRILYLRSLVDTGRFKDVDKFYLSDMIDIAFAGEETDEGFQELKNCVYNFNEKVVLLKEYKLSTKDLEYMRAYKFGED